jgi:hypothetical protein
MSLGGFSPHPFKGPSFATTSTFFRSILKYHPLLRPADLKGRREGEKGKIKRALYPNNHQPEGKRE